MLCLYGLLVLGLVTDELTNGVEVEAEEEKKPKRIDPLVVILLGAPGSGKTTFCNDVMRAARRPWSRICQDTIANGKAGTKAQCLKRAADALKDGKSVFIDRCNLEREQRGEFLKLGGGRVEVHAVVLDLPARLCISRSVNRIGHEGNLQGGRAAAVVNRMLQKKEPPKLSEGFSRITFCQNEKDVKDAVHAYGALGVYDSLPSGAFGQKSMDSKVQLGIMKYLKKVEKPDDAMLTRNNGGSSSLNATQEKESREDDPSRMDLEKESEDKNETESKMCFLGGPSDNKAYTLAFPSISTSDFQFSHDKASDIIVETVAGFLKKVDNVRLVLVDLSRESKILSLVRSKATKRDIDPNKFFTFVGDITRLSTEGNLHCNVIANAANWRLKPGGGGVNAAIFKAAGESLETATKECAKTLTPGSSVVVPLPSISPLYQREGVTHVVHVLGPNMNPQRPNYLRNDYGQGCNVLRSAYVSLFENFASLVSLNHQKKTEEGSTEIDTHCSLMEETSSNQSPNGKQKLKREGSNDSERNKRSKGLNLEPAWKEKGEIRKGPQDSNAKYLAAEPNEDERNLPGTAAVPDEKVPKDNKSAEGAKRNWGSWAQALYQLAMHPEKQKGAVSEISDDFIVLSDLYPKAKRHFLVVSRLQGLDSLADVRKEHLPILQNMHSEGLKWTEKFIKDDPSLVFRLGYHSVPSMRQLHLHVVSQDFNSGHLKNKKHWNSFTTLFFCDSVDVLEEIDKHGKATLKDDNLLSMELRCHRCRSAHPSIPRLKSHIVNCKASFPPYLLQNGRLVFDSSRSVTAS